MPDDAKKRYEGIRRILVKVPEEIGWYLDMVVKYSRMTKGDMWMHIFSVGFREVFGQDLEDMKGCSPSPIPNAAEVIKDRNNLREIGRLVCPDAGERSA